MKGVIGDFIFSSDHSHLFRAKLRYVTDGALQSILVAFRIFPSQVFYFEGWTGYEILLYTVHTSFIAHEVTRFVARPARGHVQNLQLQYG